MATFTTTFHKDPTKKSGIGELTTQTDDINRFIGTGSTQPTPPTTKGEDAPIQQPAVEGTFKDVETGRPSGVSRGGRTFFIQGSDLELFQQQQDAKDALSGGQTQGLNPRNTIAQNLAIRQQQSMSEPLVGQNIAFQPQTDSSLLFGDSFSAPATTKLLQKAIRGELTPQEMQMLGINEFDLAVLRSGEAEVSHFGQMVEGIPIIGKKRFGALGFKFSLSDLAGTTPSEKVQDLLDEIKKQGTLASDYVGLMTTDPINAQYYREQIIQIEQNILTYESRIKLLSIQSPSIQGSPDNVIAVQTAIQGSLNSLKTSKTNAGIF